MFLASTASLCISVPSLVLSSLLFLQRAKPLPPRGQVGGCPCLRDPSFQLPVQPSSPAFTDGWTISLLQGTTRQSLRLVSLDFIFFRYSSIWGVFVLVICCCAESLSCSMQDLLSSLRHLQTFSYGARTSSLTRDQTLAPCIGSTEP